MNSRIALLLLTLSSSLAALTGFGAVSPAWDWGTAAPESEGLVASELESMWSDLEARKTTALAVIREDRIVFERDTADNSPTTKHDSASMAKAWVGGVSVALTLSDGLVSLDRSGSHSPGLSVP